MTTTARFFSFLPIEFYVIFLPSTFVTFFMWVFLAQDTWIKVNDYHLLTILKSLFFNAPVLGNTFIYVLLYIALKYLLGTMPIGRNKHLKSSELSGKLFGRHLLKNLYRVFFWLFFISTFLSMGILLIGITSRFISADHIAQVSEMLMYVDYWLFHIFPPYAIQTLGHYSWFAVPSILAYVYTPFLLGVVGFFSLFVDKQLFRKFFLMLALSFILSFPLWLLFPAVTPNEMYRHNMFNYTFDEKLGKIVLGTDISPQVSENINVIEKIWIDPNTDSGERSIAVTTMPSMHIIWGMQIAVFCVWLYRKIKPLAITFFVFNTIGTMLLLQHYAIDLVVGVFVGALALYLSTWLLKFEKSYFVDHWKLVHVLGVFERDAKMFSEFITTKK